MKTRYRINGFAALALAGVVLLAGGCGETEKKDRYDTNLLTNGSFEKVGKDGIPEGWTLTAFRGLPDQQEVQFKVDDSDAIEGEKSWNFKADLLTRRFYALTQEVEVEDITHVRLRGWMRIFDVARKPEQFSQCNFVLTFYDADHRRFQELRFADKRTRLAFGSRNWWEEDHVFRVPQGTRYVMFSCLLGMNGTAWYDDVSLEIPQPMDWVESRTANYVFHHLPGNPFPEGAQEQQQALFNHFCERLNLKSDVVLKFYLYPDTASIRDALSLKGHQYVSWDDFEIHTISPIDNHELIHFITGEYGVPPRAFAEGTVFWLHDDWLGDPVDKVAAFHRAAKQLPNMADLTDYNRFSMLDVGISFPTAASFIGFIVDRWGVDKLIELYGQANGLNNFTGFSQAFEIVYGAPLADVENAWYIYLGGVDISDMPDPAQAQSR